MTICSDQFATERPHVTSESVAEMLEHYIPWLAALYPQMLDSLSEQRFRSIPTVAVLWISTERRLSSSAQLRSPQPRTLSSGVSVDDYYFRDV